MSLYYTVFFLALLLGVGLTPVCRAIGIRWNWVDTPNERKIHENPIPYLGGWSILISFLGAGVLGWLYLPSVLTENTNQIWGLFIASGIIFFLGVADDARGLNAPVKFTFQIIASIILWYTGGRIEILTNPFGGQIQIGIFGLPLTILWLVGVTNAMNLIDGLDGLACGVSYIASFTLFLIALLQGEPIIAVLMAALAGSTLGFLRFNLPPASIFMGNSGAMTLGFLLASTAVITRYKATIALTLLIPIVALGIPILDTLFAIFRRAYRGRPIFQADREHLHHRLLKLGLSPRQVVFFVYLISIFLSITAFSFIMIPKQFAFLILIGLGVLLLIGVLILRSLEKQRGK